jgi:hypothetical protein
MSAGGYSGFVVSFKVSCFTADKTEGDRNWVAFFGAHVFVHF